MANEKFTFFSDNGDERYAGQTFDVLWGDFDPETNSYGPTGDCETCLIDGPAGLLPLFNPSEFGYFVE